MNPAALVRYIDRWPRAGVEHWKARGLDFSQLLYVPQVPNRISRRCTIGQNHGLEAALDAKLIEYARPAIDNGEPVEN